MQQIRSQIAEEMAQSKVNNSQILGYQSPQLQTSLVQPLQNSQMSQQKQQQLEQELQQSKISQEQIEADHQILAESLNDQQQQLQLQKSNFNDFTDHMNHFMETYSKNLIDIANTVKQQAGEIQFLKEQNSNLTKVIQKQADQLTFLTKYITEQNMCSCEAQGLCHCCCGNCEECSCCCEECEEESKQSEGEVKC